MADQNIPSIFIILAPNRSIAPDIPTRIAKFLASSMAFSVVWVTPNLVPNLAPIILARKSPPE